MNRSWMIAIIAIVSLPSFSCMSVRDRIAQRLGLPTKYEMNQAYLARNYERTRNWRGEQRGEEKNYTSQQERPLVAWAEHREESPAIKFFRTEERAQRHRAPEAVKVSEPVKVARVSHSEPRHAMPPAVVERPATREVPAMKHEEHAMKHEEQAAEHDEQSMPPKEEHAMVHEEAAPIAHEEEHAAVHEDEPALEHEEEHAMAAHEEAAHEKPVVLHPVVASPVHPEVKAEDPKAKFVAHPKQPAVDRYALEKEAARLRWEASLMKMQSEQLRGQIALLDKEWEEVNSKVAAIDGERSKLREEMASLEFEIEKTRAHAAELEARWTRFASAK